MWKRDSLRIRSTGTVLRPYLHCIVVRYGKMDRKCNSILALGPNRNPRCRLYRQYSYDGWCSLLPMWQWLWLVRIGFETPEAYQREIGWHRVTGSLWYPITMTGSKDVIYVSSRAIRDYSNSWLHHVTSRWSLITHAHVNTFTYGVLYLHSWNISVVPLYASEYIRFIDRSIGLRLHAMIPWNFLVLSCTSICVTEKYILVT